MEKQKSRKNPIGRILKVGAFGTVFAVFAVALIEWLWALSGSGEWDLKIDKDGVLVYALKSPGDRTVKFKSIIDGNYNLSQLTAMHVVDDNLATCKEWYPNCVDFTRILEFDTVKLYDTDMWEMAFPFPFANRELAIKTIFHQDQETGEVTLDVLGCPNVVPYNPGKVRIERFTNKWKFIPLGKELTRVEVVQNLEMGGLFPYYLMNMMTAGEHLKFYRDELPRYLSKEKYKNAKLSFVKEYEDFTY